ncbi:mannosyl-oligosaccharide alpha-1,2-mannosidase [Pleurotus pulmonarius]|nr:mannosyl-oligosaccharide alpha-1,2-mannosidase [Pleurotus pulmonarius]
MLNPGSRIWKMTVSCALANGILVTLRTCIYKGSLSTSKPKPALPAPVTQPLRNLKYNYGNFYPVEHELESWRVNNWPRAANATLTAQVRLRNTSFTIDDLKGNDLLLVYSNAYIRVPDTVTAGLRKRRKDASPSQNSSIKHQDAPRTDTQGSAKLIYTLAFVGIALLSYFNSPFIYDTATLVLDEWIGSSDHWDATPSSSDFVQFHIDEDKRQAVVNAFKHAWSAYERDAMGDDEYHPISMKGTNLTAAGGIGYTVIDSLDTMLLMGLTDEYSRARRWVDTKLSFDRDANFNTFETTIRVLGGLLSAFHLSSYLPHSSSTWRSLAPTFPHPDRLYLDKAIELANLMLPVFDTPSGLPTSQINLAQQRGAPNTEFPDLISTAEAGTLQLEFRQLSEITGDDIYWKRAEKVMSVIKAARLPHGLASIFMSQEAGQFVTSAIRLGSRGDSFYEYLLKQYLQTNRTELVYRDMYDDAMQAIHNHLVQKSYKTGLLYTSELIPEQNHEGEISWRLTPKQDHLVCFLGGSLMLGATTTGALVQPVSIPPKSDELTLTGWRDWKTGVELIKTCMRTHDTATGLAPEMVHFRIPSDGMDGQEFAPEDWYIKGARPGEEAAFDARYILRPETVESLFIAYRLTGDLRYRDSAWSIFQAIDKHCKVDTGGYASIMNVDELNSRQEDKMETFFLSETLKYLYLIFSDDSILPLDKYVFNTEAHPLPIFNPTIPTGFS